MMKGSLDKVLGEARQLASRMRAKDETADLLLGQATGIQSRLDTMRQYQEEVVILSTGISRQSCSGEPVMCLAGENRQLDQLRTENEELKVALEEYQATLELVMSKYRGEVLGLFRSGRESETCSASPSTSSSRDVDPLTVSRLMDRLANMMRVVRKANSEGDLQSSEMEAVVHQLLTENEGLKQLLAISQQHQFVVPPPESVDTSSDIPPASAQESNRSLRSVLPRRRSLSSSNTGDTEDGALSSLDHVLNNYQADDEEEANQIKEASDGDHKKPDEDVTGGENGVFTDDEDSVSVASSGSTVNLSSSLSSLNSVATVKGGFSRIPLDLDDLPPNSTVPTTDSLPAHNPITTPTILKSPPSDGPSTALLPPIYTNNK